MDLRTRFVDFDADWLQDGAGLATDDGLETAVVLSLFTDRRANPEDVLPDPDGGRRGWFGDSFPAVDGDRIGSRLWLLHRERQTDAVLERARGYAAEALAWLKEDGVASAVDVAAEYPRRGVLALEVRIARAEDGPVRYRFETFWSGSNAV